jgi:hypothetical protein
MAGDIRLFERNAAGLLVEIAPDKADERRAGRRISSVNLVIHVLFTDDEERAQDAELARLVAQTEQVQQDAVDKEKQRSQILARVGMSVEEIRILLG